MVVDLTQQDDNNDESHYNANNNNNNNTEDQDMGNESSDLEVVPADGKYDCVWCFYM